jgi:hypothetical protein
MERDEIRDLITVENEHGQQVSYEVEALFEMNGESYALLRSSEETILMKVEEDDKGQHLVGLSDDIEKEAILDVYEIAVDAAPAD